MSLNKEDVPTTVKRSKIPRYIRKDHRNEGIRKISTDSKVKFELRSKQMLEPKCRRRILENTKKVPEKEIDDIQFEPDPQALESILNNKGITQCPGITTSAITPKSNKMSSVFNYPSSNRMSMWESHAAFKQSLKLLRERLPQSNHDTIYGSLTRTPKTPESLGGRSDHNTMATIDSGKRSSIYYQPSGNRISMMESYLQHKENMRIFREKMQQISTVPETLSRNSAKGHKFSCQRSKTPGQYKIANSGKSLKLSASQQTGDNRNKMSVPQTTSLNVTATQSSQNFNTLSHSTESTQPADSVLKSDTDIGDKRASQILVKSACSVENNSAPILVECWKNNIETETSISEGRSHPFSNTCNLIPKTLAGNITAFLSNNFEHERTIRTNSSTQCTWSKPDVVCTHSRSQSGPLSFSVSQPRPETFLQNNPGLTRDESNVPSNNPISLTQTSSSSLLSSQGTPAVGHTCQSSASADMYKSLSNLTLSSIKASSSDLASRSLTQRTGQKAISESVSSSLSRWPKTPSPAPVRVQSVFTPVSQPTRIAVQACASPAPARSPFTPMALNFLNQPPRRTPALSSCLKMKGKDNMPVRKAITSVKKLRWADAESPVMKT